ncbi:hypothetical protein [Solitalea lacus]|uniref:hypothetical protein n=1 Tax=Solitalea lacus TaxID=2911172 RepID=UPI001EDB01E1|nr:hypothetical protein [Solitalea lacus]UKJ08575.1 hypothetical protein L2B55_05270 [Solitalea lacus]
MITIDLQSPQIQSKTISEAVLPLIASKKITVFILLFILFFQFEGAGLLFLIRHQQIKNEVKEQISSGSIKEILTFKLSKQQAQNDLQWKEEQEFCYLGKSYDVIKQEHRADSTVIYCILDARDTSAYALHEKIQEQNAIDKEKNQKQKVEHVVASIYLKNDYFYQFYETISTPYSMVLESDILDRAICPPYPPPWLYYSSLNINPNCQCVWHCLIFYINIIAE